MCSTADCSGLSLEHARATSEQLTHLIGAQSQRSGRKRLKVYSIEQALEAYEHLALGAFGKVVIKVDA